VLAAGTLGIVAATSAMAGSLNAAAPTGSPSFGRAGAAARPLGWSAELASTSVALASASTAQARAASAEVSASAGPASTSSPSTEVGTSRCRDDLDAAKARLQAELAARLARLDTLEAEVSAARHLAAADAAALSAELSFDHEGIAALQAKVAGDTTCAALASDAAVMVRDYRVDEVMSPKTRLVIAADEEAYVAQRLAAVAQALSRVAAGERRGAAKAVAQTVFNMQAKLQAADQTITGFVSPGKPSSQGLVAALLSAMPAGFPAARQVLVAAYRAVLAVRGELKAALDQAVRAIKDLRREVVQNRRRSPAP
jgi:hypothetical protein